MTDAAAQTGARRRALVIAMATYDHLPALPEVEIEASRLVEALADPRIGRFDVTVAINETRGRLQDWVADFFTAAAPGDTVLIYYGGHGLSGRGGDELWLAAVDAKPEGSTGIFRAGELLPMVSGTTRQSSGDVYLLLDCSYSGLLVNGPPPWPGNLAVLTSAGPGESSVAGRFTRVVVEGLGSGAADIDRNGSVDVTDLFKFARDRFVRERVPQTPNVVINGVAETPIAFVPPEEPTPPPPPPPEVKTDVPWLDDGPARVDLLRRKRLADVIATRLDEVAEANPGTTFSMHLDGAWGTGKSSLLGFLDERIADRFLVVRFNAWRQSRLGPAWWAVLTSVRAEIMRGRPWWWRLWCTLAEAFARGRRLGPTWLLALAVLTVLATGLLYLTWPAHPGVKSETDVLKLLSAALAVAVPLWAASKLAGRFLLWHTARSARLFEQAVANPLREIYDHFRWLTTRTNRMVILLIDDLDRCSEAYVVDFLETLQTLVRDDPAIPTPRRSAVYFLVAADGTWLRRSFEVAYQAFDESVAEPGRPLGTLFLDKLFQLTVPMPALGSTTQAQYFATLLGVDGADGPAKAEPPAQQVADLRRQLDAHRGNEQAILHTLQTAPVSVRDALAGEAALALTEPEVRRRTEHALRRYAPLMESNPRSIKLVLNTYSMLRAVRTLETNFIAPGPLLLWSILTVRWPSLAEYLAGRPEAIEAIRDPLWIDEQFPEALQAVAALPAVRAVVEYHDGGPLTPDLIRRCRGAIDDT